MRSGRWSRRVAPLGLGLALVATLPSVEVCSSSRPECRVMFAAAEAARGATPCEAVAPASHAQSTTDACDGCPMATHAASRDPAATAARAGSDAGARSASRHGGSSRCSLPSENDTDLPPLGSRACIHPPAEVVAPRSLEITAPLLAAPHAAPVRATIVLPPPVRATARTRRHAPSPAVALPHTPPQGRAPPIGLPANLF